MLNNLNWPPLEQRRKIAKATMLFKIINNLIAIPHDHISKSPCMALSMVQTEVRQLHTTSDGS